MSSVAREGSHQVVMTARLWWKSVRKDKHDFGPVCLCGAVALGCRVRTVFRPSTPCWSYWMPKEADAGVVGLRSLEAARDVVSREAARDEHGCSEAGHMNECVNPTITEGDSTLAI